MSRFVVAATLVLLLGLGACGADGDDVDEGLAPTVGASLDDVIANHGSPDAVFKADGKLIVEVTVDEVRNAVDPDSRFSLVYEDRALRVWISDGVVTATELFPGPSAGSFSADNPPSDEG